MPVPPTPDRRRFLTRSLAAGLFAAAGPPAARAGRSANDLIEVGVIGIGGRGRHLMERLRTIDGVRIAAVCDVWDAARAAGQKLADPRAAVFADHRTLLDGAGPDGSGPDAVLIAAPDHQHVPLTIAAVGAGCDVYVEKPLTHDPAGGDRLRAALAGKDRIVQVGTQQRSMPHLAEARDLLRTGVLGRVVKVRMTWNRNQPDRGARVPQIAPGSVDWPAFLGDAPPQPFDPYRFRQWRWFWDFGGGILTDLMVHWLDTARWFLDLPAPTAASAIGHHFVNGGRWQTPDTVQTLVTFPSAGTNPPVGGANSAAVQLHFEGTFANHTDRAMCEFQGEHATLYIDRGRYELIPQHRSGVAPRERIDGQGLRGLDFYAEVDGAQYHLQNWIDCVRTRATPACPAEEGIASAAVAHLANAALRG